MRKIIHIDMDAFYASVEQRDNPDLRGKALAVGGSPEGRGVVATASYEARKFGVRSAMSSRQALVLCPHLLFVRPRFDVYKEVSGKIREIFSRYTDLIEPLSLDEAFLDVSTDKLNINSAIDIAKQIRASIWEELQLTASAGISVNKFIAKIASDMNKPDGLTFIGPSSIGNFIESLPVEKFFGVGKVTAEKMKNLGLHSGFDLKQLTQEELTNHFGKQGTFYYKIVRGEDEREVQPYRETKSVGVEDTFMQDLHEIDNLRGELDRLARLVAERLTRHELRGRTITLKIKYSDFKQITRSVSIDKPIQEYEPIYEFACSLLLGTNLSEKKIRLLGISLSNFSEPQKKTTYSEAQKQLKLFQG